MRHIRVLSLSWMLFSAACGSASMSSAPDSNPAPTCSDGRSNGTESDIDCGGATCSACELGRSCAADTDCQSRICRDSSCVLPSCIDGRQNGDETGVDCGGSCARCGLGSGCKVAGDCTSRFCKDSRCEVSTSGRLGTLTADRDGWSLFDGWESPSQKWLKEAAPMGAGLSVEGISSIDDQALASFKSFVLIFDSETSSARMPSINDLEAQALKRFVLRGGSVAIFFGLGATYPSELSNVFAVDMQKYSEGSGSVSFTPELPATIQSGPFGVLPPSLGWYRNHHELVAPRADSKAVLLAKSTGRNEAAYIPPGALGSGSGPVFFFGDWYWSYSHYVDEEGWGTFFKNSIMYLMNH